MAAKSFRENPEVDTVKAITELGVGEVLVSLLDPKGAPTIVDRAYVVPPVSQIGPITPEQRQQLISGSIVAGIYDTTVDRESAFEILSARAEQKMQEEAEAKAAAEAEKEAAKQAKAEKAATRRGDSPMDAFVKSAARSAGTAIAGRITRGILGGIFGTTSKKKTGWF